jgi:replicative DNA helicase
VSTAQQASARRQPILDTSEGKIPPQAPELEQAVLGAILLDYRAIEELPRLKAEHFYVDAHQRIYAAAAKIYEESRPVDLLTVAQELKRSGEMDIVGGPFYLSQLTNGVSSTRHIAEHAMIVIQYFMAREVIRVSQAAVMDGYDPTNDAFEIAESAERHISELMEEVARKSSVTIGDVAAEQMAAMDSPAVTTRTTGFERLDKALNGGYSYGDLIIIAGRPAMGKTSAAFSGMYHAAAQGNPTALFSLELGEVKTNARLISIGTGIPVTIILANKYSPDQLKKLHEHHATYSKMPLYTNFATGLSIGELRSEIGRMKRRYGITAAYIDQLTWVQAPKKEDHVSAVTMACKKMAVEFNMPIILLHQLSRDVTKRKDSGMKPELTDLRDSGSAEQNAQVVIFAHRPEYYAIHSDDEGPTAGRADLIIAKNSNGPLGLARLRFDGPCTAFREDDLFSQPPPKTESNTNDEPLPF